ncbi:MAG: glycosyltransferase [Chloroflexota bacterium]|nr:MAG: glycosyltransferase [Chloroflexota bacterium]
MATEIKKKISIFMPTLFGAGGQRSMLNLAHGITDKGYPIDLVLAKIEGEFVEEVRDPINVVNLKSSRALTSLPSLIRYLRAERPAAMISVFNYVNIIAIWAWKLAAVETRLFVNEQNTLSQEAGNASNWRGRMTPILIKRFYPWADGIIVVSNGVREDMSRLTNIPLKRITVIYNPSVNSSEVLEKSRAPLDHPWFKPGQPPVLVAVGRLQIQKDYPTLIKAFAEVRKVQPARLMILGEGIERETLEGLIAELGISQDVSLPGFVKNPYAYIAQSSLFVLSSRWEGLPTVLIEALCCGTPAVSTDCPSGPREILKNGQYGTLTPVGDVDALSQAIIENLNNNPTTPPVESWQPYEVGTVVEQYITMLLGNHTKLPS